MLCELCEPVVAWAEGQLLPSLGLFVAQQETRSCRGEDLITTCFDGVRQFPKKRESRILRIS
jgi:hypothetical protein